MAEYTDDLGEMDGANAEGPFLKLSDLLPGTPPTEQWPIRVLQTRADGSEETVSFSLPGEIQAIRMGENRTVTFEFDNGKTFSAHLKPGINLANMLGD
jgi:hypothetical protein